MKERLEYFDALRAASIIMVVYGHIYSNILNLMTSGLSYINEWRMQFSMPLFFFISGFFTYSFSYSIPVFKRRTRNRLLRQLYPTIILMFIMCYIWPNRSYVDFIIDEFKGGFWFTIVSVEIFLIAAPFLVLFYQKNFGIKVRNLLIFTPPPYYCSPLITH